MLPVRYPASSNNRTPPQRQALVYSEFTYTDAFGTFNAKRKNVVRGKALTTAGTTISNAYNQESDVDIKVQGYLMPVKIKWTKDTYTFVAGFGTVTATAEEEQDLTSSNSFTLNVPWAGAQPANGLWYLKRNFRISRLF